MWLLSNIELWSCKYCSHSVIRYINSYLVRLKHTLSVKIQYSKWIRLFRISDLPFSLVFSFLAVLPVFVDSTKFISILDFPQDFKQYVKIIWYWRLYWELWDHIRNTSVSTMVLSLLLFCYLLNFDALKMYRIHILLVKEPCGTKMVANWLVFLSFTNLVF